MSLKWKCRTALVVPVLVFTGYPILSEGLRFSIIPIFVAAIIWVVQIKFVEAKYEYIIPDRSKICNYLCVMAVMAVIHFYISYSFHVPKNGVSEGIWSVFQLVALLPYLLLLGPRKGTQMSNDQA